MQPRTRVVYLTNIPAPYRERMHELLAASDEIDYNVIYCSRLEPNREWKFKNGKYKYVYLKEQSKTFIHNDLTVISYLKKYDPQVVVLTGFNPTMLYGVVWCLLKKRKLIPYIDGTFKSELKLSFWHKLVRKVVFKFSPSFAGASLGSLELFKSYNIPESKLFKSCLCIENHLFSPAKNSEKKFDMMFSGQMIDLKMPFFFVEIAKRVKDKLGSCNVLLLGNGPLRDSVLNKLDEYGITYHYPGFVQPADLPKYYNQSKVFLFPTKGDAWGIVANEACASGVPVITCDNAGAANDLIINGKNGYVLPLDVTVWADHVIKLIQNEALLQTLSANALQMVQSYNPSEAASGLLNSIKFALSQPTYK